MKCMNDDELEAMLEAAAERGAKRALHELGLDDENAPEDLRSLRGLLRTLRLTGRTALTTAISVIVVALLGLLAAGVFAKIKILGGGP